VRSTGSGMGCPDWPKCFGSWIPPTQLSQLPPDYKTKFMVQGKEIADFDAFKTWVEYLNRLLGVLIGFLIIITFIASFRFFNSGYRSVFLLSGSAFILVVLQGWLGAKVVSTDLAVSVITLHMFLAILILFVLILAFLKANQAYIEKINPQQLTTIAPWIVLAGSITLIQIFLGTQVRQSIDEVSKSFAAAYRDKWIGQLGIEFYIHRSFSWLVMFSHLYVAYLIYKIKSNLLNTPWLYNLVRFALICIVIEIVTGVWMAYGSVPAFLQPIHLFFAVLAVGIQFGLICITYHTKLFAPIDTRTISLAP